MRILHTSDWHVGKRLGRFDRMDEYGDAIAEVVAIADAEDADLAIISGDLFDRPRPPVEAMRLVFDGLVALTGDGRRPVVAVAGNHDSPELFEALAPFFAPRGIHLVGDIKRPADGGVLQLPTRAGLAAVACFPFLRQGRVVDFMEDTGAWYGAYADKVRAICDAYARALLNRNDAVTIMAAHFMVTGARIGDGGANGRRGERQLHIGQAYAAAEQALPRTLSYVAMGHIHAPQPVPAANVPAQYAGSLLQLDFGEAAEQKRVVLIEAEPDQPATIRSVPLSSGRPLVKARGSWNQLKLRTDLAGAYLDLTVETDGPDLELAERARGEFPFLVAVRPEYDREESRAWRRSGRSLPELYEEFSITEYGSAPPSDIAAAFVELLEEAELAST